MIKKIKQRCLYCGLAYLMFFSPAIKAQRSIFFEADPIQGLSFGSFYGGLSGGTLTVTPEGICLTSGTIVALANSIYSPAIFEIRSLIPQIVHMVLPSSEHLTRSGGKETITITNFTSDKLFNIFIVSPFPRTVHIGATLKVQSPTLNPPGNYKGTFTIIFVHE